MRERQGKIKKYSYIILITVFGFFFSTPPSNSPIPAGCPAIQLSSDTVNLETASDSAG